MQTRFELSVLSLNIDLHVFADPHAAHLWHSQVLHRIPDCGALRIEHRSLSHHNHLCLHQSTIFLDEHADKRNPGETPFTDEYTYFKITTSSAPLRRSTLTPTSPSSCLVSRRSTRASPTLRSRMLTSGRKVGKTGFENTSVRSGADTLKPRQASSKRKTAPDAQACGLQATGYSVGDSPGRLGKPQNNSGRRCRSKKRLA